MKKEIGLEMVHQAFEKGVEIGNIDSDTADKYFGCVQNFINNHLPEIQASGDKKAREAFNPKFWKGAWVDGWFDKLADRYDGSDVSASYVLGSAHAFGKLQELVNDHGVWKGAGVEKVRVGLKGSIESEEGRLHTLYCRGIGMSQDEVTSIKAKQSDYDKLMDHLDKVIKPTHRNYDSVRNVLTAQRHTGGRITAEVNLKAGDIQGGWKRYDKDKNTFSRNVPIQSEDAKKFYDGLTTGKSAGSPMFPILGKDGKQMEKRDAGKYVQDLVRKVSAVAGLREDDKRYTTHSTRRLYAQDLYGSTRYTSKEELKKKIAEYVNKQGSNREGIIERIKKEKIRLNYYRIKKRLPQKGFTWEQMRRLYVSLHLGHSRIDHVKRYIEYDVKTKK